MSNESQTDFVPIREAAKLTGLASSTIRKMADKGDIACYRTPSDQRRISIRSIQALVGSSLPVKEVEPLQKQDFIYARVSTKKQLDDLSRQVRFILGRPEYASYTVVTDIASGINFKRKGLSTILDACLQKRIGDVVVAHRDRLCRFGFDLLDQLVSKAGGRIVVLESSEHDTPEQELAEDLLSIVHVFSCRQMGKRSYGARKPKDPQDSNLSDPKAEGAA